MNRLTVAFCLIVLCAGSLMAQPIKLEVSTGQPPVVMNGPGTDAQQVLDAIDPRKDVDGFHPVNAGRLALGLHGFVPCTPLGCLKLLRAELGDLTGKAAVVIGRSNIVGKPMAQLLLKENCTVTIAHSRTRDLLDDFVCVRIVQAKHGIRRDKWGNEVATADSQENLRLKEEITDLKGRIATLERIATDNNSALDLDREIERLR